MPEIDRHADDAGIPASGGLFFWGGVGEERYQKRSFLTISKQLYELIKVFRLLEFRALGGDFGALGAFLKVFLVIMLDPLKDCKQIGGVLHGDFGSSKKKGYIGFGTSGERF